jgi:hypothetical protein
MIGGYGESCKFRIKEKKTPPFSYHNQRKGQKALGEAKNADAKVVVVT